MAKVLIIEDDDSIRKLLRYDIKSAHHEVVDAMDGTSGLELGLKQYFDVIICDWMLPGISGLDCVKQFRGAGYAGIIIMLTAKGEEEDILEAFEAGVDDYLTKPFSPRVLTARIQAHLTRHERMLDQNESLTMGNTVVNLGRRTVSVNGEAIELTKREFDLLVYLIEHQNRVQDRDQILSDLWDFGYDGDTRIVDVHVHKLRTKLDKSSIVIESKRGVGYVIQTK